MRKKQQTFPRDKDLVNFLQPERKAINLAYQLCKGDIGIAQDPRAIDLISKSASACNIIKASPVAFNILVGLAPTSLPICNLFKVDAGFITLLDVDAITIPTMTSYTAPYGVASASTELDQIDYQAWKAMDGNDANGWLSSTKLNQWIQYVFNTNVWCYKIKIRPFGVDARYFNNVKMQYSTNGSSWNDATGQLTVAYSASDQFFNIAYPSGKVAYWRLYCGDAVGDMGLIFSLQFYCK